MMKAFGAEVSIVPSHGKGITEQLIKAMIAEADALCQQPGHWWVDQLNNHDGVKGYHALGKEIWQQTSGEVSAFVHAVGTAHSIHGVTEVLWRHTPEIQITAVEPAETPVLSGGDSGSHGIDGIGIGFVPPLWDPGQVNQITTVSTAEAKAMARRLAQEEGIFAGTSSGANAVAALRLAEQLGPDETVVTLMVDSGLRYLSTDVFAA